MQSFIYMNNLHCLKNVEETMIGSIFLMQRIVVSISPKSASEWLLSTLRRLLPWKLLALKAGDF